jgi:2,3-bisphosphoglycerate-independent phosphoglycerate mutase
MGPGRRLAYDAITHGKGDRANTAADAVAANYADGKTDEFFLPSVIGDYSGMKDGDGVFCLNFRADRARQILRALGEPGFAEFDIGPRPDLTLLGMVDYSKATTTAS